METKREHFINSPSGQRGNALIYVLVAVALFAALSMTLTRQTDSNEAGTISEDRAELYAAQLIGYAAQTKSVVDQMLFTGSRIDNLVFTLPTDAAFNTAPHIEKVYHPEGGGLSRANLPEAIQTSGVADPISGWYLGRFNNVEWTDSASEEVILVAYQISQQVCEKLNLKTTGSASIPVMTDSIKETMIDESFFVGSNTDLTTDGGDICPDCENIGSLCVQNADQDAYGFYTIIADQ